MRTDSSSQADECLQVLGQHRALTGSLWMQVSFTFEIPYIKRYQPEGLTYYYTVYQDERHGRQRMERGTAEKRALETVIQNVDEVRRILTILPDVPAVRDACETLMQSG